MCSEFTEGADWLHVDLRFLDFVAGLFGDDGCHILRGDRAVEFASFASLGREGTHQTVDLRSETFPFRVLFSAADLSLRTNLFDLLERTGGSDYS